MAKPTVTAVSPTGASASASTLVTITGTNFTKIAEVYFGATHRISGPTYDTKKHLEEAVEKGATSGFYVESATKIFAYPPQDSGVTVNVTVKNVAQEESAAEEANSFIYWAPQEVKFEEDRTVETVPLGSVKSSEHPGSFYKAAGAETFNILLQGNYGASAYLALAYNIEELEGSPEVEFIVQQQNIIGEWEALGTAVHTGVISTVSKKEEAAVSLVNKPFRPTLRLQAKFTKAGGIAGFVYVTSTTATAVMA